MNKPAQDIMYMHPRCHILDGFFEIIYNKKTNKYNAICDKCGKDSGLEITGPDIRGKGCECALCKLEAEKHG